MAADGRRRIAWKCMIVERYDVGGPADSRVTCCCVVCLLERMLLPAWRSCSSTQVAKREKKRAKTGEERCKRGRVRWMRAVFYVCIKEQADVDIRGLA